MLSKDLELTLAAAFREAESRRHEYVTLEHLLYAILHNDEGLAVISACGGEPSGLREQLETFFRDQLEEMPGERPYELELTLTLRRLLDRVVTKVKWAEREEAHAGDVLAAIMQEPHSHAAYFLRDQGITRLDILETLSHGVTLEDGPAIESVEMLPGRSRVRLSVGPGLRVGKDYRLHVSSVTDLAGNAIRPAASARLHVTK